MIIQFPAGFMLLILFVLVWMLYPSVEGFVFSKDPLLGELQQQLSVIHPRFQNMKLYEGSKSYTLNKKHVYICLKDEHGRYYNRNMLVYVILHEYAHVLCPKIDEKEHSKEFFQIFDELLMKATQIGLYNPSIPPLKKYCGVVG